MRAELKSPVEEQPQEITPVRRPLKNINTLDKQWAIGRREEAGKVYQDENRLIELSYRHVLVVVKSLFSTLPDTHPKTVFQRDYKYDDAEEKFLMHCFMAPTFFCKLECHPNFYYFVEYDFYTCPFKAEIQASFRKNFYHADGRCNQKRLEPNCEQYYNEVVKDQDQQYITVL